MAKLKEKKNILLKAWLVSWVAFGDEERIFTRHGIKNKVIDVLGPRVKFQKLNEIAEDYFEQKVLTLSERIRFHHYTKGSTLRQEFFKRITVSSSYQSKVYQDVIKQSNKETRNAWIRYPKYYLVGHNPAIEIREVINLEWSEDDERRLHMSWEQVGADGKISKETSIYEN